MADKCASQVEAALHRQMSAGFDDLREQFAEDELLGEVFRSNYDSICVSFTSYDRREKQEDEKGADDFRRATADRIDRQFDVYLRCLSQMFMSMLKLRFRTQRAQSPLESSEHKVGKKRQQRRRNGSGHNHLVVHHGQSAKNKFSESARANRCCNRRQSNGEHRRNSQSSHNDSRGQRQLHLEEQLTVGQPHSASRLDHRRIDAANARVSIANQRQERIERQRQDREPAAALANPRRWKKKAEQGEAWDSLDYVRAAQHRLA